MSRSFTKARPRPPKLPGNFSTPTRAVRSHSPDYRLIHRVADRHRPAFAAILLASLQRVKADVPLSAIHDLVHAHRTPSPASLRDLIPWDMAIHASGAAPHRLSSLTSIAKATPPITLVDTAGNPIPPPVFSDTDLTGVIYELLAAGWGVGATVSSHFTLVSPDMVAAAELYAGALITEISSTTQSTIAALIGHGIAVGTDPMTTAQIIRDIVGLTQRQAIAVANYRQGLLDVAAGTRSSASLRGAYSLADSRYGLGGLTDSKIDAMVGRYADRQLAYRANLISHTETMRASNRGVQMNWSDAANAGLVDPTTYGQQWIVTDDDLTCDDCLEVDGEVVGFEDSFSNGDDGPPDHPGCRCTVGMAELDSGDPVDSGGSSTTSPDEMDTGE